MSIVERQSEWVISLSSDLSEILCMKIMRKQKGKKIQRALEENHCKRNMQSKVCSLKNTFTFKLSLVSLKMIRNLEKWNYEKKKNFKN